MTVISIESFRVTSLQIETEADLAKGPPDGGGMQFTWTTANHTTEPYKYRLNFGLHTVPDPDDDPQDKLPAVRLAMEGYFAVSEEIPSDQREKVVLINGSTILYGIARGLLAGVSGAFGNSVLLQTVDMVAIVENMLAQREDAAKTVKKGSGTRRAVKTPQKAKATKAGTAKK